MAEEELVDFIDHSSTVDSVDFIGYSSTVDSIRKLLSRKLRGEIPKIDMCLKNHFLCHSDEKFYVDFISGHLKPQFYTVLEKEAFSGQRYVT